MKMNANRHSVRLVLYNHKGGVGKTTLTVNVGAALAGMGKKVLLIDSDPQCNLTAHFFEDVVVNKLLDESDSPAGRTIWSALKPVADLTGEIMPILPHDTVVENLLLLPGDTRLSKFENDLSDFWTDCFKRKAGGLKATCAIGSLADRIAETVKADFVIYDAGPNIGPLNRALLLDCDYFVVPVACDVFSVRTLSTLGQALKEWVMDWRTIASLAPDTIPLLPGAPKYLGYIPQRFKVYGRRMASDSGFYLQQVERRLYSDVIGVLRQIDESLAPKSAGQTKLGQVKDFGALVQQAQHHGVPLADVQGGTRAQKKEAKQAFETIARNIAEMTNAGRGARAKKKAARRRRS
ncbi:MAG: AAA family ATPase [Gammaproteobacteria bacterium]